MAQTLPMYLTRHPAVYKRGVLGGVLLPLTVVYAVLAVLMLRSYTRCRLPEDAMRAGFPDALGASEPQRQEVSAGAPAAPPSAHSNATAVRAQAQAPLSAQEGDHAKPHYPPLPACATATNSPAKSWIMVFMGHSGSTAIVSELKQHSGVFFELPEPVDHDLADNATGAYDYVRDFFRRGIAAGKSPGFKMRPKHILDPKMQQKWRALVREFDTRIIWQFRENVFKQSVGEYSHRYLNDTSVVEGIRNGMTVEERCKVGAGCRFRIDNFDFFHSLLRDSINNDHLVARAVDSIANGSSHCTLPLPYESYLYDRDTVMRRLLDFLGLPHEMHPPDRAKATNDSLCSAVVNFEDLCREFHGCHAWRNLMDDYRNNCYCSMFPKAGPGRSTRCETSI